MICKHDLVDHLTSCCLQLLSLHVEYMPYAAKVEPHNLLSSQKEFRFCPAFHADSGCLGPNKVVSSMLNVEFEEWYALVG